MKQEYVISNAISTENFSNKVVVEFILSHFAKVKKSSNGQWIALCPSHNDRNPSLSIKETNEGKILLHCHAGCPTENILSKVGLTMSNLFINKNGFSTQQPKHRQKLEMEAIYDYKDEKGNPSYQVVRYKPKDFNVRRPNGEGSWIHNIQGITPLPYNLPKVLEAIKVGELIFIVEGEKCVDRLTQLGLVATCNHGGAMKWKEDHSKYFSSGIEVVILPDNDEPGKKHAQSVAKQLIDRGCKVKILKLPGLTNKGDIVDWLDSDHTKQELLDLVSEITYVPQKIVNDDSIRSKKVSENLASEEIKLNSNYKKHISNSEATNKLKEKFENKLAWDCSSKEWVGYNSSGVWKKLEEEQVRKIAKDELSYILPEGFSWSYLNGCIQMLKADLAIEEWKEGVDLLSFLNGVLHLPTMKLHPHDPKYYLRWQLPYNYDSDATCPKIEQWILETAKGDETIAKLLRAYLKAVVTGRTDLQRYLELLGQGSTGKSTYINLAIALVGLQNVFASELKELEQNRFETSNIYNKRLVVVTDAERYGGSVSTLKAIVGQDLLRFERKFENARNGFTSRAMLIVAANEVIQSNDYTSGLERRRLSVPFRNYIPTEERRVLIEFKDDKVIGEFANELAGLLNWVLSVPDDEVTKLIRDTEKYVPSLREMRLEVIVASNPVAAWFDDCVVYDPSAKTQVGIAKMNEKREYFRLDDWLYPNYCNYADATKTKAISIKKFSELLEDLCQNQLKLKGVRKVKEKAGAYFVGLRLRRKNDNNSLSLSSKYPNNSRNSEINESSISKDEKIPLSNKFAMDSDRLMIAQVLYSDEIDGCDELLEKVCYPKNDIDPDTTCNEKVVHRGNLENPSHPSPNLQLFFKEEVTSIGQLSQTSQNPSSFVLPQQSPEPTTKFMLEYLKDKFATLKVGDKYYLDIKRLLASFSAVEGTGNIPSSTLVKNLEQLYSNWLSNYLY